MQRNCDMCGRTFEAKRKDARYCGSTCRNNRARSGGRTPQIPDSENSLVAATTAELESAGKLNTILGQQALVLARRMGTEVTGVAALSKELSRVIAEALGKSKTSAVSESDGIDELRRRRDAKRAG